MRISVARKKSLKCRALTIKSVPCKYQARLADLCTRHFIEFYAKKGLKFRLKN
jgi:hypothetical protein